VLCLAEAAAPSFLMPVVTPVNLLVMAPVGRRHVVRGGGVSLHDLGKGGGNGE
jgi:hypothetical protein